MALDTATKRASALGFGFVSIALVIPNGTVDLGDKQTISHLYSGIAAEYQPNVEIGTLSIITNSPVGSSSLITDTQGTASLIASTQGTQSIITNNSVGTNSLIEPTQGTGSLL